MSKKEHVWVDANKVVRWSHCQVCGVIKRRDGQNNPCQGVARVKLRQIAPIREGSDGR